MTIGQDIRKPENINRKVKQLCSQTIVISPEVSQTRFDLEGALVCASLIIHSLSTYTL